MKLLGAILIAASCFAIGLLQAGELKRRERLLLEMKKTLQGFRTGIRFSSLPLPVLILEKGDSPFCRLAAQEEGFSNEPGEAMAQAGEKLLKNEKDREIWRDFSKDLGTSDTKGQLEHIQLYSSIIEEQFEEAQQERINKSKLYISLGSFAGLTLCILLL